MSVVLSQVSKSYGAQRAVDQVSFQIDQPEIIGFLGPNGAGKSTTLKMIAGLLTPDEGTIQVFGDDVVTNGLDARRHIGYLPEHNPLYPTMYVKEFLHHMAAILDVKKSKQDIADVIALTGLEDHSTNKINTLSKGYRQRLGIAKALLGNPDVLILDEPISGLDPNQIADIRALIKQLGQDKIIIYSSHILQEVEANCDRLLVINKGKIVANDRPQVLLNAHKNRQVELTTLKAVPASFWSDLPDLLRYEESGKNQFVVTAKNNMDLRPELFHNAVKHDVVILEMKERHQSMEHLFADLTKVIS